MGWEFKSPLAHRCTHQDLRRSMLVVNASTASLSLDKSFRPSLRAPSWRPLHSDFRIT